ncbi:MULTISPECIES: IclR family transcriptional regulator [unclassified Paraburkholderia]|uniref:IclR family transcriptional regulator n=1 Tax=unclassified Paraburkholderia TaxID=2615204 RepID=UPI001617F175|nr:MULTISPECIES: IclR family transcriptional regulator [unclassified Paraburkholderia]MBB5443800.1 DNA-binding IclR family transcriptional regulator [Paraburkholderia sp. WSM4177]MBB5485073.1 DNA-binding IclR family transcriptional regulator [Paraburkholderia sp. WSM4180]
MLSILDLFSIEKPVWSLETICTMIGCSTPTAYRYLRELVDAGLLARLGSGSYTLGPRVMTLDYQLRTIDPFFSIGHSLMRELSEQTGCDCVMTRMFDEKIVDTHRESSSGGLDLAYGRGRPRPLFLGAAPKVILATLPRARLKRLFEKYAAEIRATGMGDTFEDFWHGLQRIRKSGYYISRGELEAQMASIGVPLFSSDPQASAALALVTSLQRFEFMDHGKLLKQLTAAAQRIATAVADHSISAQ